MSLIRNKWIDRLDQVERFGIGLIPIHEASILIAYELWFSRHFDLSGFKRTDEINYEYLIKNEKFYKKLTPHIEGIENSILASIERGEIKTALLMRHLVSSLIDTTNTLVSTVELEKFFHIHGLIIGDRACPYHKFHFNELVIFDVVLGSVKQRRMYIKAGEPPDFSTQRNKLISNESAIDNLLMENFNLSSELYGLKNEIAELKEYYEPKEELIHKRTKNNYLRLIMALAEQIIGFNKKNISGSEKLIVDKTGLELGKGTIGDILDEACELERKERE